jgi:VIT1/CCC1 family predicted Fe2+/Mn2+ transporter
LALATVGVLISLVTGRSAGRAALRQVLVGALAAGLTFAAGSLVGMAVR